MIEEIKNSEEFENEIKSNECYAGLFKGYVHACADPSYCRPSDRRGKCFDKCETDGNLTVS